MTVTQDPIRYILANLRNDEYSTFVSELGSAIRDVCAFRSSVDVGAQVQKLTEVVRSWHLTIALRTNEGWVAAMNMPIEVDEGSVGTIEDLRSLLRV
jgi:hypothetical protein